RPRSGSARRSSTIRSRRRRSTPALRRTSRSTASSPCSLSSARSARAARRTWPRPADQPRTGGALSIHPTAIVDGAAEIDPTATIGPYCIVTGEVSIGAETIVESHARIGSRYGRVTIGAHNHIQHGAVLGGPPQDLGYEGGDYTALEIGSHNRLGEFVSIHVGTRKGGGVTRVGDHNFIMAYTHIGPDCQLADHIVLTHRAQFAGHAT